MNSLIYFFLMSLTLFVAPQLVSRYFKRQYPDEPIIDSSIIYLIFAALLPLIWIFVPKELVELRNVNFIQHAVGGGVAVGFISIYFLKNLKKHFPLLDKFIFQIAFVYALVSMLGVGNELLEFLLDTFKIGIFSADRFDTWFDLTANTIGAMSVFLVYKLFKRDL